MSRTGLDERACWQLIADLWDTANDNEASVIEDVLLRSGWCWRCNIRSTAQQENSRSKPCGAVNDYDSRHCSDCGVARSEEK